MVGKGFSQAKGKKSGEVGISLKATFDGLEEGGMDRPGMLRRKPLLLQNSLFRTAARNLTLIAIWYSFSTLLSVYNKLLMGKEHGMLGLGPFPAPLLFASVNFLMQYIIARTALASGLVRRHCTEPPAWEEYLRTIVPNGISTGLDIGFSIFSLRFITLSFYTMCKATSPLFLLFFAILWGLERMSWPLAGVVATIWPGLVLLVWGETQFDKNGFILVMSASAMSGLRWTYTQVQLQGRGTSGTHGHSGSTGGPVEVLCQLTPIAACTVGLLSLCVERLWVTLPESPYFDTLEHCLISLCIMVGGGIIAFLMVWTEFQVIAFTSALTLMVAGTFKEIVTVGAGVLCFGDSFTAINAVGLTVVFSGVVLYNWYKYQKLKNGELVSRTKASARHRPLGAEDLEDVEELMPLAQTTGATGSADCRSDGSSPRHLGSDLIKKKRLQLEAEMDQ